MRTKSIKKVLLLGLSLLLATVAVAQQTTSKEINKIKRSTSYLYAEATMETEQDAYDVAYELLVQQIDEYIASKRKLSKAPNVLVKDLKSKSDSLTMMRGEMHRVFIYVKKSDIEGVDNFVNLALDDGPQVVEDAVVEVPAEDDKESAETSSGEVKESAETPVAKEEVAAEAPMPTPVAAEKVQNPLPTWQQEAVGQLLESTDMASFRAKLNRLKAEYKVKRFGTPDKCPSVANSFWAIFDTGGRLVTILGPGENIRIDYRVMQHSSLDVYKGRTALWFTFAK